MPVVVVLPVPLNAYHHDDFRWRAGVADGLGYAVEDLLELGFEELFEFGSALDAYAEGSLAEVFEDDGGGGRADVGGEENGLEIGEGGLVDLAGEGDDGADGLGEGLASAGDRLLHAVEEAAPGLRLRDLGSGLVGLLLGFVGFAEEGVGHAGFSLADWVNTIRRGRAGP